MSYAQHNCSSLISLLRSNARNFETEMEKCRQERQQLHRESMALINSEFAEMYKLLDDLNAKLNGEAGENEPSLETYVEISKGRTASPVTEIQMREPSQMSQRYDDISVKFYRKTNQNGPSLETDVEISKGKTVSSNLYSSPTESAQPTSPLGKSSTSNSSSL